MKQLHTVLETPYGFFPTIKSEEIENAESIIDLFKRLETRGGTINPVIFAELEIRNKVADYEKWRKENPDRFFADDYW